MRFYRGPHPVDPKPIGGGLHNQKHFGHEGFNFRRHGDRLFGYVSAPAEEGILNLQRIDPFSVGSRIKGATVIYVATDPEFHGQRIVGWYKNATIYSPCVQYERAIAEELQSEVNRAGFSRFRATSYQFEGLFSEGAVLVPERQRRLQKFEIPKRNGMGEANICYPFDNHGNISPEKMKWIERALDYVDSYSGPNLLEDDDIQDEIKDAVAVAAEKGAGFQSDPQIRRKVEEYAMECAKRYLVRRKYKQIIRTDDRCCYDYTCKDNGRMVFVEVKGTQTRGEKVSITKNEKAHAESNSDTVLYILHSVEVGRGKNARISGGKEKVLDRWDPQSGSFSAVAYMYTPPTV